MSERAPRQEEYEGPKCKGMSRNGVTGDPPNWDAWLICTNNFSVFATVIVGT